MLRKIIIFFVVFISHYSWSNEMSIVFACSIYNLDGVLIRNYGGEHCIFEPNGNYLIAETNGNLSYRDKTNKIIWTTPNLWAHHGLNKNSDDDFLIMSSEYDKKFNPPVRVDIFYKISKFNGQILAEYSLLKNFHEYSGGKKISAEILWPLDWQTSPNGSTKEATHANSFYEINLKNETSKFFNNGDYIVNIQGKIPRILILDRHNLKLKHRLLAPDYFLHDVQVIAKNQIIYFNNTPGSKNMSREKVIQVRNQFYGKSRIEVFDVSIGNKSAKSYFEKNEPLFFMPKGGSIQILNDKSILTIDSNNGSYRILQIGKDGKMLKTIDMKNSGKLGIAYAKMINLSSFLKNNIGL